MKTKIYLSLFILVMTFNVRAISREVINLNREWKFKLGDSPKAILSTFDDRGWENVGLPHSFSLPYFMSKDFYVGYGWYRKHLSFTPQDLRGRIFLEFDGVFQDCRVWVNGQSVGRHVGGYTGFCLDITRAVKHGDNVLAIQVNNLWKADVAPRAGEHTFSGGIYRNVRLVKKQSTYIDWCGVAVQTPDLKANHGNSSTVMVQTDIVNKSSKSKGYTLITSVIDKQGRVVATTQSSHEVAIGQRLSVIQRTPRIESPHLWSPDSPYLYTVESKLLDGQRLIDQATTTFGFRWTEWSADHGFFLNGRHVVLQGANVHQDQAGWGDAVTEAAMARDVRLIKDVGFNFIRGSHYPHAPQFVDACNSIGLCFWSEVPFWGIGGFQDDGYWNSSAYPIHESDEDGFEKSVMQQLEEMIRIHRNHPSVIAWSMCNEAFFSRGDKMGKVRQLLARMVARSHQLDSTRVAAIGGSQRPLGSERIDIIGDVAGYNGDGASIPEFQHPPIPSLVSEYGSVTADRPGEYSPCWGDLSKTGSLQLKEWRSGHAIWCGFDHGSIAGAALGKMGIVDYFRIPKQAWYWYRNQNMNIAPPALRRNGKPAMLLLRASKTDGIRTDGTDDVKLTVAVADVEGNGLSNSPAVKLKVISGPGEFPTGKEILFEKDSDIRIQDGEASIALRSYYAGETKIAAIAEGMPTAYVTLHFVGEEKYSKNSKETTSRPYQRFVSHRQEIQTFGYNNPAFSSSDEKGHNAGMATDDDDSTYWQASSTDKSPCWTLDTEKRLSLKSVDITFPDQGARSFSVEVSTDGKQWETIAERTMSSIDDLVEIPEARDIPARFVRVRFSKGIAALSNVRARGIVK